MASNAEFLERAWSENGPKLISGFSRPLFHNLMGLLHGYKYDKKSYGGMIRHSEAGMLYCWSRQLPPLATIVEIGCYGGLSTSYLAAGCKGKQDCRIYSIDPFSSDLERQAELTDNCVSLTDKPTRELVSERLTKNGFGDIVELIEGYSQDVAAQWSKPIDFLWIDGNHEQALQDFNDFRPWLKKGARVALHDAHPRYGYQEVVRDVAQIFASDDDWCEMEHVKSIITGIYRG
ncbi:class I SAM-dependent methyltransferase [Endozoicomonadaceae bacterium StTr2]